MNANANARDSSSRNSNGGGSAASAAPMTTQQAARQFGCEGWHLRNCLARGLLAEPPRVGRFRMFSAEDAPRVREALEKAGYLRPETD